MRIARIIGGVTAFVGLAVPAYTFDFTTLVALATGDRPSGVASGDYDRDGDIDLAVASDNQDKVQIFLNAGNGSFGSVITVLTGSGTGPDGLATGDFDNDGDTDIAVSLNNVNQVRLLVNNGGSFVLGAANATGAEPTFLGIGDLNQDGNLDVASANRAGNNVTLLLGNGGGGFTVSNIAVGVEPRAVAMGNIDGDGDLDMVVSNHDDRSISILRNLGGTFLRTDLSVGGSVQAGGIAFGDLNLDGDLDIATATSSDGQNFIATFANDGSGAFSGPVNANVGGIDGDAIILGDLDGDADLDAAIGNETSNNLSTVANNGSGSFGNFELRAAGQHPSGLSASDLNGDGCLDLALSNRDSDTVSLFGNNMEAPRSAAVSVIVGEGMLFDGNLASLSAVDGNAYLVFNDEQSLQAGVDIGFRSPLQTPSSLGLELVSAVDRNGIARAFFLYDWVSQVYREIGGSTETTALTTKVSYRRIGTHRFVNANREVNARVQWTPVNDEDPSQDGWLHRLDYANLQVAP